MPSTPNHHNNFTLAVSQLPVVRSEHVRTLFDSTQSQKSNSEVGAHEFYAAMRIKTHLDNTLCLSSLWSDLSCAAELVIAGAPADYIFICSIKVDVEIESFWPLYRQNMHSFLNKMYWCKCLCTSFMYFNFFFNHNSDFICVILNLLEAKIIYYIHWRWVLGRLLVKSDR